MGLRVRRSKHHNSTFLIKLCDNWGWSDIINVHNAIQEECAGQRPVHIIVEIPHPINIPLDVDKMAIAGLKHHMAVNGGMLVFVTRWNMVKSLAKLISQAMGNPLNFVHFVDSAEEAHHVITEWEVA